MIAVENGKLQRQSVAGKQQLQAMASYYDHERGVVPRPTIVHDGGQSNLKPGQMADGHRNPTISVDGDGRVWVFVSGHGDKPSPSRLYFCNQAGEVSVLPQAMTGQFARPETYQR